MSSATEGTIKIAEHKDVTMIKFEGDVRLNLCLSFDHFIQGLFSENPKISIVFDLLEADAIDSTTLGLMAKISITGAERGLSNPVVVSDNLSINRLLESMGFDDIFDIVNTTTLSMDGAVTLNSPDTNEELVRKKVIEAHQFLMSMNAKNHDTFKPLIDALEG